MVRSILPVCCWLLLIFSLTLAGDSYPYDYGFLDPNAPEHFTRNRVVDIHHLRLQLQVDPSQHQIEGVASFWLSPLARSISSVTLDAAEMVIQRVWLNNEQTLSFQYQSPQLTIFLDREYSPEDTLIVHVAYRTEPQMGLYFVGPEPGYPDKPLQVWSQGEMEESHFWFPCYDFPNERMTSEMIVSVPETYQTVSNGALLSTRPGPEEGWITYHWKEQIPHVTYLISLVVGQFIQVEDRWRDVPVQYIVEPGDRDKVARSFGATPDMMEFFSQKIGVPYPYEKYAQTCIRDFMWGGMENISATTLSRGTLHDERAHLDVSSDGLVAHELAHQWWGDLLTCKNWNHIWLNEGFATYFDALYVEHSRGEAEFVLEMQENARRYFKEDSGKYSRPLVTNRYYDPEEMFDRHTYQKGAWVLHMIRFILGDDLWWKAIQHYAQQYREQVVETSDFRKAIETATGQSLEWFFQDWIYQPGYPVLQVSWEWQEDSALLSLRLHQSQAQSRGNLYRFPLPVHFYFADSVVVRQPFVKDSVHIWQYSFAEKPLRVEIDPEGWILKKLDYRQSLPDWEAQLLRSPHPAARLAAARALGEWQNQVPRVVKALARALKEDPFWGVRREAARALGKTRSRLAMQPLLRGCSDPVAKVRRACIASLANMPAESEIKARLEDLFRTDPSYFVQAEVVKTLGKLYPERSLDIARRALTMESHEDVVRRAAFKALASNQIGEAVALLVQWIGDGPSYHARAEALKALGQLGEKGAIDPEKRSEVQQLVIEQLWDENFRVWRAAVEALQKFGDLNALPPLRERLQQERHFSWAMEIRRAIRQIRQRATSATNGSHATGGQQ